jgi:hypothetical protein
MVAQQHLDRGGQIMSEGRRLGWLAMDDVLSPNGSTLLSTVRVINASPPAMRRATFIAAMFTPDSPSSVPWRRPRRPSRLRSSASIRKK